MKTRIYLSLLLCFSIFISGCNITEEEKAELEEVKVDIEKLADQIIITYPANDSIITTSNTIIRADIPSDAEAKEVILYVDGIEAAKDSNGYPWEINWPAYYWADGGKHTLLLKTITSNGTEVRNNQQYQVTVSRDANEYLEIENLDSNSSFLDSNSTTITFKEFPKASNYDIRYISNGEVVEVNSIETSIYLENLNTGSYEISYRANQVYSSDTILIGPWSDSISFDIGIHTKRFGGSGEDIAKKILTTKNGEYLILASTTSKGDSNGDDWIFKLNQKGDLVWEYIYNQSGSPKLAGLEELSDGSIAGYGYSYVNNSTLENKILLLDSTGNNIWDKTYNIGENNQAMIMGVLDINASLYVLYDNRNCVLDDGTTVCTYINPKIETVDLADGSLTSSVQIDILSDALWDGINSFKMTSNGNFLLGYSILKHGCSGYDGCFGAGIAVVNKQGSFEWEWNSADTNLFGRGDYAAEIPTNNGFILAGAGDSMMGGSSLAIFDSNKTYITSFTSYDYYINQREHFTLSNKGDIFQLVNSSSSGLPMIISTDNNGNTQEKIIFTQFKNYTYPVKLDSTTDNGLIMIFNESQGEYGKTDILVVKTLDMDSL